MSAHSLSGMSGALALALANHLWQSTVVATVAGLLTLALRRNHARARYGLWLAASIKFLVPFSVLMVLGGHLASLRHAAPPRPATIESFAAMDQFSQPFTADVSALDESASAPVAATSIAERLAAIFNPDRLIAICNREPLLPAVLAAVWLIGFLVITARWVVRWVRISVAIQRTAPLREGREFEALQRVQRLAGLRRSIELRSLPAAMEPGIFGLFRPVLLWPRAITVRLEDAHLEAVLAHEVCHVRRRDNLTAALHMVVEAIFWFFPVVWWLEGRLVEERERACDEEVLQLCGQRGVYAESILKVCEFCVEWPLPCVAGVTGADLKRRVADIVTGRTLLRMTWPKKILLVTAAVCVVVAPVMLGLAGRMPVFAQILHASGPLPSFEVATIRPEQFTQFGGPPPSVGPNGEPIISQQSFRSGPARGAVAQTSDRVRVSFVTTEQLIGLAYGISVRPQPAYQVPVRSAQIVGGPDWVEKNRYQIDAKIDDSMYAAMQKMDTAQQRKQIALMEQSLLAERFKLKVHFETREMPAYALVVAKGVAKLTPAKDEAKPADVTSAGVKPSRVVYPGFAVTGKGLGFEMKATGLSMHDLVPFLQQQPEMAGRMVADQTGLGGTYDFTMNWRRDESPEAAGAPSAPGDAPLLFAALKEQLGLQLVPTKGQVEVLVIDHIEQPTVDGAEVTQPALSLGSLAMAPEKGAQGDAAAKTSAPSTAPALGLGSLAMVQEKATSPPVTDSAQPLAYVPTMTFDVASVRISKQDPSLPYSVGGSFLPHSTHLRLQNVQLYYMVAMAYGISAHRIERLPNWGWTSFNVEAKSDSAADDQLAKLDKDGTTQEQEHMMQVLLAERFHLKAHWETRDGPAYYLVVSKRGRLVSTSAPPSAEELKIFGDRPIPPLYQEGDSGTGFHYVAHSATMTDIVGMLAGQFGEPVTDKTELTGKYGFDLRYYQTRASDRKDDETNPWAPLETAIQDQLGLKLVSTFGPVRHLVIDSVEMPTEN